MCLFLAVYFFWHIFQRFDKVFIIVWEFLLVFFAIFKREGEVLNFVFFLLKNGVELILFVRKRLDIVLKIVY